MSNLISIILLLVSIGMFAFYINPLYTGSTGEKDFAVRSIQELKADDTQYIDALDRTTKYELTRQNLLNISRSISSADRAKLAKLLPDQIDTVRLIIDVSDVADNHNLVLQNIGISGEAEGNQSKTKAQPTGGSLLAQGNTKYDSITLSFSVTGSYDDFFSFITDLEQSLRLVDIISVNFSSTGATDLQKYDFTVQTYKLKQ